MYEDMATLVKYGESTFDEYGNETVETEERDVYVMPRGVYQSEYYNAAQVGLKPSITFELTMRDDYEGEKVVIYDGRTFDVIRVDWNAQRDKLSLVCEERANGS